jgi:hypothetical protein
MVISDIFVASQNAEINGYKILAGKPFVLVTDDTKIDRSDLPMYFSNLQNGTKHQPVSLIYLANPTVGPDEYF